MADKFANKGVKFAGRRFSLNCSWRGALGFGELSWYRQHSRWISPPLRLHPRRHPHHPLPAACLSSLLSACQGNRCALRTRKAVTPSSSGPAEKYPPAQRRPRQWLSNGNQLKLIASFSSVAKLTCHKNPSAFILGSLNAPASPQQNNLFCQTG